MEKSNTIKRGYKYRLYPTPEQEVFFNKTFAACRFVYNGALETKSTAYKSGLKLSGSDLSKQLTDAKKDENLQWINEVSAASLGWAIRNLDTAYQNFYRNLKKGVRPAGYPTFKKRYSKQSFQFHQGYHIHFDKGTIDIPKCKDVKVRYHRTFTGIPKTCTVSKHPSGRYYISILVDEGFEAPTPPKVDKENVITIHLGIRNFAYLSTGETIAHPEYLIKSLNKLKVLDKKLSKKREMNKGRVKDGVNYKGSNYGKAKIKRARLHEKIANQRADFLHNLSHRLVKENNATTINIENWEVAKMMKDKYFAKYIADSAWRTFWTQVEYKSSWEGKNVMKTEKKFPSSKTCSVCGTINENLRLHQIIWECSKCGKVHDREQNALLNIEKVL